MKIQTDDDPLTTSTFETKEWPQSVEFRMSIDAPDGFYGAEAKVTLSRHLDKLDVVALVGELQAWLEGKS